ncbi:MAG: type III secretion T3S chaperone [Chlamydiales bacterium]|nr:type III secretion T3S chaperone [Chlamydiales bacterium]
MPQISDLPPYPLGQVLEVKIKRVEDAEQQVKEKMKALDIEKEKLKEREQERDKVKHHYEDKLLQLRHEYDHGTTSDKIDQAKLYIKVVQERLRVEEKKVKDQQAQVELAEKNVELAKNQLRQRQKEQDKIEIHKKEWTRDALKELAIIETREEDDVGSTMFLSKYMQNKAQARKDAKREE